MAKEKHSYELHFEITYVNYGVPFFDECLCLYLFEIIKGTISHQNVYIKIGDFYQTSLHFY